MIARVCCAVLLLALSGCDWIVDRLIIGDSPHCNRPPRELVDESRPNGVSVAQACGYSFDPGGSAA